MSAAPDLRFFAADGRYRDSDPRSVSATGAADGVRPARRRPSPRRRLEHLTVPRVIDVTQYARRSRMSGIPRVVRALITSAPGSTLTPAVWDRGALCPVTIDPDGEVSFPPHLWRRAPSVPLAERIHRLLRATRAGSALAAALGLLGLGRIAAVAAEVSERRSVRRPTRARCTIDLSDTELIIPEVVRRMDAETLLAFVDRGGSVAIRLFVHDLLPITHPEYFERSAVLDHVHLMRIAAASMEVATSSDLLTAQVRTTLEGLFGASPPVRTAELPASKLPAILRRVPRHRRPTLLFVGGFEARKGIDVLLDALASSDWPFDVIVLGEPRHHQPDEVRAWRRASATATVHVQRPVDDRRLAELIDQASAVLYLSAAEGYGLPVLEALAARTPVIAADTAINRYFAERYGGVHLVRLDGRHVDVLALRAALRSAPWETCRPEDIRADAIPRQVDRWASQVIGAAV